MSSEGVKGMRTSTLLGSLGAVASPSRRQTWPPVFFGNKLFYSFPKSEVQFVQTPTSISSGLAIRLKKTSGICDVDEAHVQMSLILLRSLA